MNKAIENLKPEIVWGHFKEICMRPHPSKHEEAVVEYLKQFAEIRGVECVEDEVGNIIMRRPATAGYEDRMGLIMQCHVDMVPQKNSDKDFDFRTDSIEAYIDGDWVTADGTTLGADNGMGAAAALAVMETVSEDHGLIEALFTIDEEAGMTGAFGLKEGTLKGDILLNLDSEDEGELYVGCAGGSDIVINLPYLCEPMPANMATIKIDAKGLKGGHSGMEIILQRANSNKILSRIIRQLMIEFNAKLISIDGGDMRNAIPREGNAVIAVEASKKAEVIASVVELGKQIAVEFGDVEGSINITATQIDDAKNIINDKCAKPIINSIFCVVNGVVRMSDAMENLVETSSNVGIVKTNEKDIEIIFLVRSSGKTQKQDIIQTICATFELIPTAVINVVDGYEGWQPNMKSPILKSMQEIYKNTFGKTPEIRAVHAGLECGIIGATYPKLDMISFGPTIRFPHSPDEKVKIDTVDKFYTLLLETIKNAPKK